MFGKLVKYEFRSTIKGFALLWIGFIVVAAINGIGLKFKLYENNTFAIPLMVYAALGVGIFVATLLFVINRFYKGLLGDEGYLMFTLPTTSRNLITSKCFAATIIVMISLVVGAVSALVFALPTMNISEFKEFFDSLVLLLKQEPNIIFIGLLGIVAIIAAIINGVYQIYVSIAIGQLAQKHRVLFAVIAFIAISIVISFMTGILGDWFWEPIYYLVKDFTEMTNLYLALGGVIVIELVGALIFHIATEVILNKKLNLE